MDKRRYGLLLLVLVFAGVALSTTARRRPA